MTEADAALRRNDAYLRRFVEALTLCPYAKQCHESGKLERRVLLDASVEALDAAAQEIEATGAEVGLLICPRYADGFAAFEQLVVQLRARFEQRTRDNPFYAVAFHPELPEDVSDPHRAIRFIRRSPDPTIQLVNARVLREVRGADNGSVFVDVSKLSLEELARIEVRESLSDRITRANHVTLQREGVDSIRALLSSLRRS